MQINCENCCMNLHIGTEIRTVLDQKGITPEWLAQKISTSRRNMYDIFTRDEISTGQLSEISKALEFDFFSLYQKSLSTDYVVNEPQEKYQRVSKKVLSVTIELDGDETTLKYWFDKLKKVNASLSG